MNKKTIDVKKTQKTMIYVSAAVTVGFSVLSYRLMILDLEIRFPNQDRKVLKKAYHRMLLKSVTGQYSEDLQLLAEHEVDLLFKTELFNVLYPEKS